MCKLWPYGVAALACSGPAAALAAIQHMCAWLLLIFVEQPHLRAVYRRELRKHSSALGGKIAAVKDARQRQLRQKSMALKVKFTSVKDARLGELRKRRNAVGAKIAAVKDAKDARVPAFLRLRDEQLAAIHRRAQYYRAYWLQRIR